MLIDALRGCVYPQIEPVETRMVDGDVPCLGRIYHVVYPSSHGLMGNVWIADIFHKIGVLIIHIGIRLVEYLQRHIHYGIIQVLVGLKDCLFGVSKCPVDVGHRRG